MWSRVQGKRQGWGGATPGSPATAAWVCLPSPTPHSRVTISVSLRPPLSCLCAGNWLCCASPCVTVTCLSPSLFCLHASVSLPVLVYLRVPLLPSLSLYVSPALRLPCFSLWVSASLPLPFTTEHLPPPRMRHSGDPQGEGRDCPKLLTIPSPALQDGPALQGDTGKGWFQLGLGGGDGGRGKGRRGEERKEGGKGGRWPWAGGQTARLLGNQPHSPSCGRAELWRLLPPPPHPPARPPLPLPHRWPWSLPGTLSFYVL